MFGDVHPEDLKAELRKACGSLGEFERQHGLPPFSAKDALRRPHQEAELAIAWEIGRPAFKIWPSRYNKDGSRKRPQPAENYGRSRNSNREARA